MLPECVVPTSTIRIFSNISLSLIYFEEEKPPDSNTAAFVLPFLQPVI
ncbi:hypothetical protein D515_00162 [Grimontia indica]|uniref:Uncharacterized protein n=1 Tax=Grimontia indica TaxID=1056512 RepID=R1IZE5_9GAMM|nr:hypothetical protein D515_00162 [Grimontia indica]